MDIPSSQFKALLGALRDVAALIRSKLNDQNLSTEKRLEESDRHRAANAAGIAEQISRLHIKQSEKRWERLWRRKAHCQQVWLTTATWLAFLAAAIYAGIAARQLIVMDQTLKEAATQTRISQGNLGEIQKQTSLLRQELIDTQAARLGFNASFETFNKLLISTWNSGVIAPTDVKMTLEVHREDIKSGKTIGKSLRFRHDFPPVSGGGGAEWRTTLPWAAQHGITQPLKWQPGWPFGETTKISGEITYFNGFENGQPIRICREWLPAYVVTNFGNTPEFVDCQEFKTKIEAVHESARQAGLPVDP
jgi:hypothetical protein